MPLEAVLGGAGVLSGVLGFLGNKNATDAQTDAATSANALQRYIYQQNRADLEPWRNTGTRSLAALQYELGLGPRPELYRPGQLGLQDLGGGGGGIPPTPVTPPGGTGQEDPPLPIVPVNPGSPAGPFKVGDRIFDTYDKAVAFQKEQRNLRDASFNYRGFEATPGYGFLLSEGEKAIQRANAATGSFFSGPMLKESVRFRMGTAAQEYNNYLNRLQAAAGLGQNAANTIAGLGSNYATQVGQNTIQAGQARATGYENMFGGINRTIGNLAGLYSQYKLGGFAPMPQQSPFLNGSGVY